MIKSLLSMVQWPLKAFLEASPFGYFIGNACVLHCHFLLPHEEDFWAFKELSLPQQGMFLDVGANDGKSARGFHKMRQNYAIYSVEANALHDKALSKLTKTLPSFRYIIRAASDQDDQKITLYTPIYKGIVIHSAASTIYEQALDQMRRQFRRIDPASIHIKESLVTTMTLDRLNLRPDVIKLDVEGVEYETLKGLQKTIQAAKPAILVEYNPRNFEQVHSFLSQLGYQDYGYKFSHKQFVPFQQGQFRNGFFLMPHHLPQLASGQGAIA